MITVKLKSSCDAFLASFWGKIDSNRMRTFVYDGYYVSHTKYPGWFTLYRSDEELTVWLEEVEEDGGRIDSSLTLGAIIRMLTYHFPQHIQSIEITPPSPVVSAA